MGLLFQQKLQDLQDIYTQRDWYKVYAYGYYGISMTPKNYRLYNASSGKMCINTVGYSTESEAIKDAEAMAKRFPGNEYQVVKVISKSVAVEPVTTTRF